MATDIIATEVVTAQLEFERPVSMGRIADGLSFVSADGDEIGVRYGLPVLAVDGADVGFENFGTLDPQSPVKLWLPVLDMGEDYAVEVVDPKYVPLQVGDKLPVARLALTRLGEIIDSMADKNAARCANERMIMTATCLAGHLGRLGVPTRAVLL